jgi:phospholipid-translocating P-type ATPase (flippase)
LPSLESFPDTVEEDGFKDDGFKSEDDRGMQARQTSAAPSVAPSVAAESQIVTTPRMPVTSGATVKQKNGNSPVPVPKTVRPAPSSTDSFDKNSSATDSAALSSIGLNGRHGKSGGRASVRGMIREITGMSWVSKNSNSSAHDLVLKKMPRSATGMSMNSFASWKSSYSSTNLHCSEQESGASSVLTRMKSWSSSMRISILDSGKRVVSDIDEWIGTVIDYVDHLEEGERFIHFHDHAVSVVPVKVNAREGRRPNRVRTAKFTMMTWLPLSLYYQFKRIANIYFLIIAIIVVALATKGWSPKDWRSKVFPFACVLLWTALKDLFEDRRRTRDDHIENTSICYRFDAQKKEFISMPWQDLLVGDVLFVRRDDTFPADLVLLASDPEANTSSNAEAFISTMSLDGETTLKQRKRPGLIPKLLEIQRPPDLPENASPEHQAMSSLFFFHVTSLGVLLAPPTPALQDVKGRMVSALTKDEPCPLNESCFLPRGCVLRNTPWVLAIVVFIGDETKVRMNSAKAGGKFSQMQHSLNLCVWGLLLGLLTVCLYSATLSVSINGDDGATICCDEKSWLIMFLSYCIIFYHVVPLSLYVCFEMLKLMLGFRINADKSMYDPVREVGAVARTSDLVEEMGQVSFAFSDKTGTLTVNEMVFARCSINGQDIGDFRPTGKTNAEEAEEAEGIINTRRILAAEPGAPVEDINLKPNVQRFFSCLAVCHAVQVTREAGGVQYTGMSPDEVALVEAAKAVGVSLEFREDAAGVESVLKIKGLSAGLREYEVLHELEFNSDRKRMSVIVRVDGDVMCITKGADSTMEMLLQKPLAEGDKELLSQFSKMGLRTLVVAYKMLPKDEYAEWAQKYVTAQGILDDTRDGKVAHIAAMMETDLEYVGITAVEDRLQQDVAATIESLKCAGIRVWVLTGDKTETAVDISRSCRLFTDATTVAYATGAESGDDALQLLQKAQGALSEASNGGLVLDGKTITHALQDETCRQLIYELGLASQACVCCRLSPKQKRELVELVRYKSPKTVTLSVGDGANDVPMLEGAHIGIGIRGKEGAQAVQVADVAISEFRFLAPLLLCHGRRSYWRVALFLNFYLYKSIVLAMGDLIWMHQNGFEGGVAFPEYLSVNYNVFFTSWHIVLVLAFDVGVSDQYSLENPELYLVGPRHELFNVKVFTIWMIRGVYHGFVIWIIPNLWYGGTHADKTKSSGEAEDFWVSSCSAFCILVIVVMLKLLLDLQNAIKVTAVGPTLLALLSLIVILGILGYTSIGLEFQPNMEDIPTKMIERSDAKLGMLLSIVAALSVDVLEKIVRFMCCPRRL